MSVAVQASMAHASDYHSGVSNKSSKKDASKPMEAVDIVTPAIPIPSDFALPKCLSPPASGSNLGELHA